MAARLPLSARNAPPAALPLRAGAVSEWYWAMPELAVMFFVLAIIAFIWIVDRHDAEQRRETLIGDILWLEQNIRFHLQSIEDVLATLAREAGEGTVTREGFRLRAGHLLKNNPELTQVARVDASGVVRAAVPAETGEWRPGQL